MYKNLSSDLKNQTKMFGFSNKLDPIKSLFFPPLFCSVSAKTSRDVTELQIGVKVKFFYFYLFIQFLCW